MKKLIAGAATVVALGAGISLASAGGGGGDPLGLGDKPGTDREFEAVPFSAGPGPARELATASKKKKKPKLLYLNTDELPIEANGIVSIVGTCPKGAKPIDGGFASDGGVVADTLAPVSTSEFAYSVVDLTGTPGSVVFTLICTKNNG